MVETEVNEELEDPRNNNFLVKITDQNGSNYFLIEDYESFYYERRKELNNNPKKYESLIKNMNMTEMTARTYGKPISIIDYDNIKMFDLGGKHVGPQLGYNFYKINDMTEDELHKSYDHEDGFFDESDHDHTYQEWAPGGGVD